MAMLWCCVWLSVLGLVVDTGEGYPQEHLVKSLPGQPKVGFKQYAGYVDVDIEAGRSLFYYFVEAEVDPDNKPLTLWLNGGPGCSSVGEGAFTELGPFFPRGDGRALRRNSNSWNKASNLLFVESPVGVGWSYSNTTTDYSSDDASTAADMLIFMIEWVKKFPAFRSRDLFLCGESYAGHYIPQLTIALLEHNQKSLGVKFTIKGVAVGNALLKVDHASSLSQHLFYWSHGMYSDETNLAIKKECVFGTFLDQNNVSDACTQALAEGYRSVGSYIDVSDVITDFCYPSIVEQELRLKKMATRISLGVDVCILYELKFYFNLPGVQEALHGNKTKLPYNWSVCGGNVDYNYNDTMINILPMLKQIMQSRIPVWIYSGDQDSIIPLLDSRRFARELAHDLLFEVTVPYRAWFHKGQVGGWTTEYGNLLTFATVRGAGHMVPYHQPARALHLFSNFVRGRRLPNTTNYAISD